MILIVTGSQRVHDPGVFEAALKQSGWHDFDDPERSAITEVWHGDAEGVDQLAGRWAEAQPHITRVEAVPAKAFTSPPERNTAMVQDMPRNRTTSVLGVLALPGPESRGTWDAVRKAREAGHDVHVYEVEKEQAQGSLF